MIIHLVSIIIQSQGSARQRVRSIVACMLSFLGFFHLPNIFLWMLNLNSELCDIFVSLSFQIVSKVDESKKMITLNVSQESGLQDYMTSVASSIILGGGIQQRCSWAWPSGPELVGHLPEDWDTEDHCPTGHHLSHHYAGEIVNLKFWS